MMFEFKIDLGQLIITSGIATIGYLIKRSLDKIESRLDGHDNKIYELMAKVQELIGLMKVSR